MEPTQIFDLETIDSTNKTHNFKIYPLEPQSYSYAIGKEMKELADSDKYTRYAYYIFSENFGKNDNPYEFAIIKFDDGQIKTDLMNNNGNLYYTRKGITPAMIKWIAKNFASDVESSNNKHKRTKNEERKPDADVIWEKMIAKGEAHWDETKEVYIYKYTP